MNTGMELTTRAYRSRRGKIGATLAVVVGALVVLGSTAALAASRQASPGSIGSAGFQSGTLRVEFTDGSGRPTHTPEMSLTGAVPGMAPRSAPSTSRTPAPSRPPSPSPRRTSRTTALLRSTGCSW